MLSVETLLSILAALAVVRTLLGVAHMFKLDGLLAAKLDTVADKIVEAARKTPDPNDDKMAAAEAAIIHAGTQMIRDGKIDQGLALLDSFVKGRIGK